MAKAADDNLRHWDALCKTDPKHTKSFQRAGGFKGTATRPVWVAMRLTEHFGPFGVGWGTDNPEFTQVHAGDEILVFCTLPCWYIDAGKRAAVYGIGGDKVATKRKDGSLFTDDEAYKKAFTDALGNAFKNVGSGADVHMGLFDDSKYVSSMREEFADDDSAAPPRTDAAGRVIPTATAYRLHWQTIIASATNAAQLHKAWKDDKATRDEIEWPDVETFDGLKKTVTDAIEFLKKPTKPDLPITAAG